MAISVLRVTISWGIVVGGASAVYSHGPSMEGGSFVPK